MICPECGERAVYVALDKRSGWRWWRTVKCWVCDYCGWRSDTTPQGPAMTDTPSVPAEAVDASKDEMYRVMAFGGWTNGQLLALEQALPPILAAALPALTRAAVAQAKCDAWREGWDAGAAAVANPKAPLQGNPYRVDARRARADGDPTHKEDTP